MQPGVNGCSLPKDIVGEKPGRFTMLLRVDNHKLTVNFGRSHVGQQSCFKDFYMD